MRKAFAVACLALLAAGTAGAQPYNMSVAGASPGGLWSLLGVGIDKAVKAEYPGSTITYQTSGGGLANINLIELGKAEIGIVHEAELKIAYDGDKPFTKPMRSARAIALLYDWAPMQLIMAKSFAEKHGIRSFEDIAAKKPPLRVTLNRRGNIAESVADRMFAAIGVTPEAIKSWGGSVIYAASNEQTDLYKDRRVDFIFNSLFVRQGSLIQAGDAVESVMLPVSDRVIQKVGAELGTKKFVIPAKSYDFQPEPVPTATLGAGLVASEKMDEKTAYNLTKALHQQIGQLQAVHGSMKALSPQLMVSMEVAPYHPGALRYWREAGLMK